MNLLPDMKHILYCTRIGPNSAYIYRYALALAEKYDASITVLHVMETLSPEQEALIDAYIGPQSIHEVVEREERDAEDRIRKHLDSFCERLGDKNNCSLRVSRIVIAEGASPAEEIIRKSEELGADVIVMGAHGKSSLLDSLIGTTATKVIRNSSVPVLVVQVPLGEQELTYEDV